MRTRRPLLLLLPLLLILAAAAPLPSALAATSSADADAGPAPASASAPYTLQPAHPRGRAAVHELTVALIQPPGIQPNYSRDAVVLALRQVAAFYDSETNGFVRLRVLSLTGWTPSDDPGLDCSDGAAVVDAARRLTGWEDAPNANLLAMVPDVPACGTTSSTGLTGSVNSGGAVYLNSALPAVIAHELGHTFSIDHARSMRCTTGWDVGDGPCARDEYGDHDDPMAVSYAFSPFSAGSLDRLGLIQNRAVPTCGATRRIPIQTMSAGYDGQRIISWKDPRDTAVTYYVQYRDRVDVEEYRQVWDSPYAVDRGSGVQILRTDPQVPTATVTLTRPGDRSARDQLIGAGERVALDDGMSVTVAGIDEAAHTAAIDVYVPCR